MNIGPERWFHTDRWILLVDFCRLLWSQSDVHVFNRRQMWTASGPSRTWTSELQGEEDHHVWTSQTGVGWTSVLMFDHGFIVVESGLEAPVADACFMFHQLVF